MAQRLSIHFSAAVRGIAGQGLMHPPPPWQELGPAAAVAVARAHTGEGAR